VDTRGTLRLLAVLDTNVLVYAEGVQEVRKRDQATDIVKAIPPSSIRLPAQVLGELFHVLVRRARRSVAEARLAVQIWRDAYTVIGTTDAILARAMDIAVAHGLAIWDAILLAAASEAGCRLLLSEDMQDGFTWGGVTIVNPFAVSPNRLLAELRDGARCTPYVSTSAPCSSSTAISRVCCSRKSMTTRVRGARLRRDGYTMWTGTRCES
jgi:predicted nucleic acid-binding protein